jgi:DNA-binding response OmpR family regulator
MKYRLLVADDLEDSADSLGLLLQSAGHQVSIAYDGESAWRLTEAERPHAALLDVEMPKMGGIEVCRRIREQAWGERMVLVALTGWSRDDAPVEMATAGFDLQVTKPLDFGLLLRELARLCAERDGAAPGH